jgi:hypothetical protein
MKKPELIAAAVALSVLVLAPNLAEARIHHHYRHYANHGYDDRTRLPYPVSYLHNYGPGYEPGRFAYYDGPSTNHCYQGSAAYVGQDRRVHPCF